MGGTGLGGGGEWLCCVNAWLHCACVMGGMPAASGFVLIACGDSDDARDERRGERRGEGPMLQEHRREVMLKGEGVVSLVTVYVGGGG